MSARRDAILAMLLTCFLPEVAWAQESPAEAADGSQVEAEVPAPESAMAQLADVVLLVEEDDCLTAQSLLVKVRSWLRRDEVDPTLIIRVRGTSFEVVQAGEVVAVRQFETAERECEDVRAMMGLAVALAIDASILDAFGAEPEREPEPEPQLEADSEPEFESESAAPEEEIEIRLRLGGFAMLEMVDALGAGGHVGAELSKGGWALRIGALGTGPSEVSVGGGTASTNLFVARMDLCHRSRTQPTLGGCLGFGVGQAFASGKGYAESHSAAMGWLGGLAGAEVGVGVADGWTLEFGLEVAVPVVRPELTVGDSSGARVAAQTLPAVGGTLGAGLSVRLW